MPGVAYPGVRDNRSTLNTKTGYDDDDDDDDTASKCLEIVQNSNIPLASKCLDIVDNS